MAVVLFGLGSNVGSSRDVIQDAANRLGNIVRRLRVSGLYRSAPMYRTDQESFVNAAAIGETSLGPRSLLRELKRIEQDLGRVQRERNGPREIDLDLLAYGALQYRFRLSGEEILRVPHPKISERRFVLLPLYEIAPDFPIPGMGTSSELLPLTKGQANDVTRLEDEILSIHRQG